MSIVKLSIYDIPYSAELLHCRDVHRASVSRLPDLHLLTAVSRPMSKLDRITIYRTEPTSSNSGRPEGARPYRAATLLARADEVIE
jgi:hypothetical protein